MTGSPQSDTPPPPPGQVSIFGSGGDRERPWWDATDVLLAVPWFALSMIGASIVTAIAITIGGGSFDADTPVYALFFGVLSFQILQATYPWLVSKRKGLGIEEDWRFVSSLPNDIFIGMLMALFCFGGAWFATVVSSSLVGLADPNDASNTDILVDNQGSPWLIGVIALVVVGAPLAEELLFRGLILRALQKNFGSVFAIIASTLLFAIPHWQPGASWRETTVLLSALAMVGLVLAIGAVVTNRLGPSVIAHFLFNASSTIITLAL